MRSISSCCHHLGQQAAVSSLEEQQQILCKCRELAACGAFARSAFLSGVISQLEHVTALDLVHLTASLFEEGLFGLPMLQRLLPAPQQAADMIIKAVSSQEVCLALVWRSSTCDLASARHQTASPGTRARALLAVLQLLKAVLLYSFDTAAVATADSASMYLSATAAPAADLVGCVDAGLQQYLDSLLQQLQEAAMQHAVLAICLLKAAADCSVLCDTSIVASWVSRQLCQHLHSNLRPPPTAALSTTPAATPPTAAVVMPSTSWTSLAAEPLCWAYIMLAVLQCMPAQAVLEVVQDTLSTAAGSVTGLSRLCDIVTALEASGHGDAVLDMLSGNLSAALAAGDTRCALSPLLLGAHLVTHAVWGKQQYLAMLKSVKAACMDNNTAVPVLLRAFNLLLHTAEVTVLEAHVEILQQLKTQLSPLQQDEAFKTEGILRDVLAHRQQILKQEQQARQGGRTLGRNAYAGHSHFLEQYMQWPADGAGHKLTPARVTQWRLMGVAAAESFCEAFVQQPPDSVHKARACLAYIQELQANRLCKPHHADAFSASCVAYGLDLAAQPGRAQGQGAAAADPLTALQGLLDRLPVVVAAGSRPGLSTLLSRIIQTTKPMLDTHQAAVKQQQQQQGHAQQQQQWPPQPQQAAVQQQGCVPIPWPPQSHQTVMQQQGQQQQQQGQQLSWPPQSHQATAPYSFSEPAAKKARLVSTTAEQAAAEAEAAHDADQAAGPHGTILDMLLAAYASASAGASAASGAEAGWDWRVEYLGLLHELPGLHGLLLQRLIGSLQGCTWAPEVSPQQALWHGSLLAWLSVSKLQQLPCLAPPPDAAVTTAPVATPLFKWHSNSPLFDTNTSSSSTSSARGCKSSTGERVINGGSIKGGAGRPCVVQQQQQQQQQQRQLHGLQLVQHLINRTSLTTPHSRCCAASFWAGYVGCIKTSMGTWCAGPLGPFGSQVTANTSPGLQTDVTQAPHTEAPAAATAADQQQLVAYVPPQLAALLQQLVSLLTKDAAQAAEAAAGGLCEGGVRPEVTMSALQVCTRALRVQAVKWVCQLYGL